MQTPKKGTVKKTAKPKIKSNEKIMTAAEQFTKGFTDSFKPIVEGMKTALPSKKTRKDFVKGLKTVVPKSKYIKKAIESTPEYKVVKGIKKGAGFKKGGMIRAKKK